jgi:hypothetical protein
VIARVTTFLRQPRAGRLIDAALTALLATGGYFTAVNAFTAFQAAGGRPQFYQQEYDAAVMQACGRGFHQAAGWQSLPPLKAFLEQQTDTFDCAQLPRNWPATQPDLLQRASRYLLGMAALEWRLRGVSWSGLVPLFGMFYAAAAVAAYWTLRLGMRWFLAAPLAYVFLTSPLQLTNLPHLRDYAKTPFVIGLFALTGWMVRRRHSRRALLALSVGAGLAIGIGIGVRTDLLLLAFAAPVTILIAGVADERRRWPIRAQALGAYLVAFLTLAYPVLKAYASGNNIAHVIVLGYMTPFGEALNITESYYNFGALYNDSYVVVLFNSYAERKDVTARFASLDSARYAEIGSAYLRDLVRVVPADFLARGFAAARQVLDLPFNGAGVGDPAAPMIAKPANRVREVLAYLSGNGALLGILAVIALGLSNARLAIWLAVLGLYLSASTALQFNERHYFHLEVLGLFAVGVLANVLVNIVGAAANRRQSRFVPWRTLAVGCGAALAVAAVMFGVLAATRAYQQRALKRLIERLEAAPVQPVDARVEQPDGSVLIPLEAEGASSIQTTYVAAWIAPSCPYASVPITAEYDATAPYVNFQHIIDVRLPDARTDATRVFIPAYTDHSDSTGRGSFTFKGVAIPAAQRECLQRVARVEGPPAGLLPFLVLRPDWKQERAYERWRGNSPAALYSAPPGIAEPLDARTVLEPFQSSPAYLAPIVRRQKTGWRIDGRADGRFTYLLQSRYFAMKAGSIVRIDGFLKRGGLTIGLVVKDRWVEQINITTPGAFRTDIRIPSGGDVAVVVANCLPGTVRNSATIDRAVVLSGSD